MTVTNFGTVVPGRIYRGAQPVIRGATSQYAELKAIGVTTIIDLREGWDRGGEANACKSIGLVHVNVPIGIAPLSFGVLPPTGSQIRRILALLNDPLKVCFVHCEHGEDRTGAVIAAYRMTIDHWTNAQAMAEAETFHINPLQVLIKEWIERFRPEVEV